jgi:hypothetical protein
MHERDSDSSSALEPAKGAEAESPSVPRDELTVGEEFDSATVGVTPELAAGANDAERPRPVAPGIHPQVLGRYQVVRLIGQGGFGQVFLARDPDLDRDVAVKVPLVSETFARDRDSADHRG